MRRLKRSIPLLSLCTAGIFLQVCYGAQQSEYISNTLYVDKIASAAEKAWAKLDAAWGGATPRDSTYANLILVVADSSSAWEIDRNGSRPIPFETVRVKNLPNNFRAFEKLEREPPCSLH
ncbi:hypothetical protein FG002_019640 [Chitinimonas sp. BJB300]|nr:hypothetical protein FG002_019640 [Chitinimonas sp. BJB300]